MASDLANIIGLEDDKPLLLSVAPKEYGWDFVGWAVFLCLRHPLFWFNLLATLALNVEWEIVANHIPATALWIASILLGASSLLPALLS